MLEAVGHPVAVNPDRVLARYAREHGYEITRFVQPVRLRDRVRGVRHRITSVSVPVPPGRDGRRRPPGSERARLGGGSERGVPGVALGA